MMMREMARALLRGADRRLYSAAANTRSSILTDSFSRHHTYLRISLTERCNLRCTYCMPSEGVPLTPNNQLLDTTELNLLVKYFVKHGINKIRFTGGEPLVRRDLVDIVRETATHASVGTIAVTTNGLVLSRKLSSLIDAGLTHVNISLDTLDPHKFQILSRRLGHDRVLAAVQDSVECVNDSKLQSLKLNCVLIRGVNDSEILDFIDFVKDKNLEFRFIEYMPFDGNKWSDRKLVDYRETKRVIETKYRLVPVVDSSGNNVSKVYQIEGHVGRVGFITSMSEHFCGTCNRLRLTADGQLKVCLFDGSEVSVRDLIRSENFSEAQLDALVKLAVMKKKASHAGWSVNHCSALTACDTTRCSLYDDDCIAVPDVRDVRDREAQEPSDDHHRRLRPIDIPTHTRTRARTVAARATRTIEPVAPTLTTRAFHTNRSAVCASGSGNHTSGLSHVSSTGQPTMVDVSHKSVTHRSATARTRVLLPPPIASILTDTNSELVSGKGPVLATAIIAGTLGVKQTHTLIPFCHPLSIEKINFTITIATDRDSHSDGVIVGEGWSVLVIECTVKCSGKTGVEMEALTGTSVAALTVYDMCKALSHDIVIADTQLLNKQGGKTGVIDRSGTSIHTAGE